MNDRDFIKKTNLRLKRRSELKDKKKKGPDAVKQPDPKRMTEIKRLLQPRIKELESQEAQLIMKFAETYPPADLTLSCCEMLWAFLQWLRKHNYHIVSHNKVFCVPFSHLADPSKLK